jgi:hypothetical protein
MTKTSATPTNRLIHETSPYLLQHAHNPVDWYPWGEEALHRARREDKPILLSIGYSACHWCHVMERESFEDPAIAALMNEHFVNVKVDREERPDLDDIYMQATLALNQGQGGWPMTLVLSPELEPVFAGTYFPPDDRWGRPGFASVLHRIADAWRSDPGQLRRGAGEVTDYLRTQQRAGTSLAVGEEELRRALARFAEEFDDEHGGFGSAPKFPPHTGLALLFRVHRRFDDPDALRIARGTLDGMARGGIYDHVGGGFARYATDRRWLVPHFEKMLYDNAQLTRAYLEGWQVTGDARYRRVAGETLDYVLRDMTAPEGGFYSSTDADSEGEEGKFFVWTPDELAEVLSPPEVQRFAAYYDITEEGNWEGKSIPHTPRSIEEVAWALGIGTDELEATLDDARARVFAARERRVKPGLDDKVLTSWNGLMIGAMAEGFRVLGERRYRTAAERAADFALSTLTGADGRLLRTYRAGRAHLDAYLEDYAYLAEGLIDLYEAGGDARYLHRAEGLMQRVLEEFADEDSGSFFATAHHHERLLLRHREGADGATPSANASAACALARLAYHLDRGAWRDAAARAIKAYGRSITAYPRAFGKSLCVVDFLLEGPVELALVGHEGASDLDALRRAIAAHYLPNRIQGVRDPQHPSEGDALPLLRDKTPVDGRATLYVCRDFTCRAPITDPADVADALPRAPRGAGAATIAPRRAGRATREGTARYAARFAANGYRDLGGTGLTTSLLGFGGYRVDDDTPEHRDALRRALAAGINLVDTSTNYMDGASERLVGDVLREAASDGELARDEMIVVSKIGYVQGRNYALALERERLGDPFPEMVKLGEGMWHCIHPAFIADQLERTLDRLELETLDVCLLHNPEYYLEIGRRGGVTSKQSRAEFHRRVTAAFAELEQAVADGRLGCYGVSSNTVTAPATAPEATSLTRFLEAAETVGGTRHHFAVLQLPMNLLEAGAVFERNTGPQGARTVLEEARARGIGVLVNRPLNAVLDGTLIRLADIADVEGEPVDFEGTVSSVADLEDEFRRDIAPLIRVSPESLAPEDFFRWAEPLAGARTRIRSLEDWGHIVGQVTSALRHVAGSLEQRLDGELAERWTAWRQRYLPAMERVILELRRHAASRARAQSAAVRAAIDPHVPTVRRNTSLSQKALWTAASTPGVTCVLNGMRRVEYVDDAVGIMNWEPLADVVPVYRAAEGVQTSEK